MHFGNPSFFRLGSPKCKRNGLPRTALPGFRLPYLTHFVFGTALFFFDHEKSHNLLLKVVWLPWLCICATLLALTYPFYAAAICRLSLVSFFEVSFQGSFSFAFQGMEILGGSDKHKCRESLNSLSQRCRLRGLFWKVPRSAQLMFSLKEASHMM